MCFTLLIFVSLYSSLIAEFQGSFWSFRTVGLTLVKVRNVSLKLERPLSKIGTIRELRSGWLCMKAVCTEQLKYPKLPLYSVARHTLEFITVDRSWEFLVFLIFLYFFLSTNVGAHWKVDAGTMKHVAGYVCVKMHHLLTSQSIN